MDNNTPMRPMTTREKFQTAIILGLATWMLLACLQGIAYVFFGMTSGKSFLVSLAIGGAFAFIHTWTTGNETEVDGTDEAGA